ncbi:MAG TPA: hypothetical protein VFD04_27060 [Actinomycetes bacterium]|jgi:hypothetical protein|nr:hypothetical protein [Actinomycetes bacterium]
MAAPVILGLLAGFVAGALCMAVWAANRIEEEASRQYDRGFDRGRWLADVATANGHDAEDEPVRPERPAPRPTGQRPRRSLLAFRWGARVLGRPREMEVIGPDITVAHERP